LKKTNGPVRAAGDIVQKSEELLKNSKKSCARPMKARRKSVAPVQSEEAGGSENQEIERAKAALEERPSSSR